MEYYFPPVKWAESLKFTKGEARKAIVQRRSKIGTASQTHSTFSKLKVYLTSQYSITHAWNCQVDDYKSSNIYQSTN